jgi:DNA mismatch repair protein MutS
VARKTTPMMDQYFRIKEQHRDCLLLFRLGDFYEMFGEDAVIGSRELEITLTSRDRGKKERIPLCGVPWHSLDAYLPKLLRKGYKVAICEQMEDARKAKGLVERDVVRIVTPGTVLESSALDSRANNYLMAISEGDSAYGISFADISTGEFVATQVDGDDAEVKVLAEFAQRMPKEVLYPAGFGSSFLSGEFAANGAHMTELDPVAFIKESSESVVKRHYRLQSLDGIGLGGRPLAVSSSGAILRYIESTQKRTLDFLSPPKYFSISDKLVLDQTTLRNLEVVRGVVDGGQQNTLVSVLDRTLTPMGSRLLRKWVTEPSTDAAVIDARLDAVEELVSGTSLRSSLGDSLSEVRDLERLISKVIHGSANARDLVAVRACLEAVPEVRTALSGARSSMLRETAEGMGDMSHVAGLIARAVVDDPPVVLKDGGLIREGYDQPLDDLRRSSKEGKEWIAGLEASERKRTGIKNLRLGFNNVFGYYLEVSKANAGRVPADYERKQTITGGERYVTPELKEKEKTVLAAHERMCAMEYDAIVRVRDEVASHGEAIREVARRIASLDALLSFSEAAVMYGYCRPRIVDGESIILKDARHPVVERVLGGAFVPNDVHLDTNLNRLILLTGPNMAGKSTYLRQIASVVVMAQAGSFVPASEATIGIVDRIFTRVGAFDDLSRGQSTFMVEMTELANILNCASRRSLILLDEVGRGTSTFDGLAIAWAVVEHLYSESKVGAKTLFATHYHQLTELGDALKGVRNCSMAVKEQGSEVVFLRKVIPGKANKSYGIQVARLAGVPPEVIARAEEVLDRIEEENVLEVRAGAKVHRQTFLTPPRDDDPVAQAVAEEIRRADMGAMTPMEAFLKLNELKKRLGGSDGSDKGP